MILRVAVAKWRVGEPGDFPAFAARVRGEVLQAAAAGAQLLVLPEYLSLELAATFDNAVRNDLHASLAAIQRYRADWLQLFSDLARESGTTLVAGTFLLDAGDGRYRNRADLFTSAGMHLWQDKLQLTGFEKSTAVIEPGDALKVFDVDGVRLGIAICYDIEFPLLARAQWEAGARLLLVPSCTDTAAGATRVRTGCLARALENRCFVAQSVTAGEAAWSPALDTNTGEAAVYAAMDVGLPADGIVASTVGSVGTWVQASLDFDSLESSRCAAQVGIDRDWPRQLRPGLMRARV
ncbi:carbon-nitrogen hydrolase family protein [Pseudofulvimonas gallinarii]|jgi:predicted amidohydrolase|uniref:Putative amidohydrolase n=1 Tax=Pseudofulvimonas gallinarii TaxID=634155 RepID=A0A4S3KVQ3_9GAMM|nr:carbon-nitrogen hydrolase family protein [Pseudofulvimonas gallinarii]TCS97726.1 putative amidohydrolase [Pseudofulvimonas gallinarii]THD13359.1 nitrilase [Pseudofulvimonas gallinarii]